MWLALTVNFTRLSLVVSLGVHPVGSRKMLLMEE
jgi:hypothetical protein